MITLDSPAKCDVFMTHISMFALEMNLKCSSQVICLKAGNVKGFLSSVMNEGLTFQCGT